MSLGSAGRQTGELLGTCIITGVLQARGTSSMPIDMLISLLTTPASSEVQSLYNQCTSSLPGDVRLVCRHKLNSVQCVITVDNVYIIPYQEMYNCFTAVI